MSSAVVELILGLVFVFFLFSIGSATRRSPA